MVATENGKWAGDSNKKPPLPHTPEARCCLTCISEKDGKTTFEFVCLNPSCPCHLQEKVISCPKAGTQHLGCGVCHPLNLPQEKAKEESWERPTDFKEFMDFAIDSGVPFSAFWDDAEHCTCFFNGKDGEDDSPDIIRGMYQMWKSLTNHQ